MSGKPMFVVVGNCQASFICNILNSLDGYGEDYTTHRFRNYRQNILDDGSNIGMSINDLPRFVQENRSSIVAFITQKTHNWIGDPITRDMFSAGTSFIEFPACILTYHWPNLFVDHRLDAISDAYVRYRYPNTVHDRLVARLVAEGVPRDRLYERYMDIDPTRTTPLARLREISDAKTRQVEAMSSFPISDLYDNYLEKIQLYRNMNHPSGFMMAEVSRRIFDQINHNIDRRNIENILRTKENGPGIQNFDAPIDPRIAAFFGLDWARADRWEFWEEGYISHRDYIEKLYDFHFDLNYRTYLQVVEEDRRSAAADKGTPDGVADRSAGRADLRIRLLTRAAVNCPGSFLFLRKLADEHYAIGDHERAFDCYERAHALCPGSVSLFRMLICLQHRRSFDEETYRKLDACLFPLRLEDGRFKVTEKQVRVLFNGFVRSDNYRAAHKVAAHFGDVLGSIKERRLYFKRLLRADTYRAVFEAFDVGHGDIAAMEVKSARLYIQHVHETAGETGLNDLIAAMRAEPARDDGATGPAADGDRTRRRRLIRHARKLARGPAARGSKADRTAFGAIGRAIWKILSWRG